MKHLFFVLALLSAQIAFGGCLSMESVASFSPQNCASQPSINRVFGGQAFEWGNSDYVAVNVGNEIELWNVNDPTHPVIEDRSGFGVGNVGDSDYDLQNFSFCDSCRYGTANYKRATVFFELGIRQGKLNFLAREVDYDLNLVYGSFVFRVREILYVIGQSDQCTGSALYEYRSTSDRHKLECVSGAPAVVQVVGGHRIGTALYLEDVSSRCHLFSFEPNETLKYISEAWRGYYIKDKSHAFDDDHRIAINTNNGGLSVFDTSDEFAPVLVSQTPGTWNRAALAYPVAFVARKGFKNSEATIDIADMSRVDAGFWAPGNAWNFPGHQCSEVQAFTAIDETSVLLYRYSRLQRVQLDGCHDDGEILVDGFESGDTSAWN